MDFERFANKVNEIAITTREQVQKAQTALDDADAVAKRFPVRYSEAVSDEYLERSHDAAASLARAKTALEKMRRNLPVEVETLISAVRGEFMEAVTASFAANPAQIDAATMELLRLGIMTPMEYKKALTDALESENPTMARIVAKFALDAAQADEAAAGTDTPTSRELRAVAAMGAMSDGSGLVAAFDGMAQTLKMCVENYPLFDQWEALTAPFAAQLAE